MSQSKDPKIVAIASYFSSSDANATNINTWINEFQAADYPAIEPYDAGNESYFHLLSLMNGGQALVDFLAGKINPQP